MGQLFDVLALLADQGADSLSWNKKVGDLLLLSLGTSAHNIQIQNYMEVWRALVQRQGGRLVGGPTACWWGVALAGGTPYKLLGCDE